MSIMALNTLILNVANNPIMLSVVAPKQQLLWLLDVGVLVFVGPINRGSRFEFRRSKNI